MLVMFKSGNYGFATKQTAKMFTSSSFMGRLSTFDVKAGRSVSTSFSPIAGVEGYIFLDDEMQSSETIDVLKELYADGAYISVDVIDGEFVQVEGSEPLTLDDVKKQELSISQPVATQSASMAS
tara:strand:- start:351 stop:722 length:372 start_codon:yes stop_codon:yes gene_type:complete